MPATSQPLPETRRLLEQQREAGLHAGAQVYASVRGWPASLLCIGEACPGVAMEPTSPMLWLSCSKPVGAVAIARLWEAGRLGLDDLVSRFIPEFGVQGKEAITVRHLLTHTGGFRWVEPGWPATPWHEIISRICQAPIERGWVPGEKAGYHPATSWFILGEIIQRIDGRPYDRYVRDEIFEPLRMSHSWVGMPPDVYREVAPRISRLTNTSRQPPVPLPPWETEVAYTHCQPGANGCGPVPELGRFYEMLLNGGTHGHVRLLSPETVALFTSRQRVGLRDETFKQVIDWGLGFLINSSRYGIDSVPYGYGPFASDGTFGHGGAQTSSALVDPEHGLVALVMCNGAPGEVAHHRRMRPVHAALYEDLGITGTGAASPSPRPLRSLLPPGEG